MVQLGGRRVVGGSAKLGEAMRLAQRFAASPTANVLLVGETGTGKELFARAIHSMSDVAGQPFIAVNCAAIPDQLLESELFGHERGAFTDAKQAKPGLFEVAAGGTLFLDELGELPFPLQAKLLRVLEERVLRRLGAVQETAVRCRVIAATNVLLEEAVLKNEFRVDLYYRLNVFRIDLPPLRQRVEDILPLAESFLAEAADEHQLTPKRLDAASAGVLRAHPWPGNVRELRNVIQRAALLADGDVVRPEHLMLQYRFSLPATEGLHDPLAEIRIPPAGKTLEAIEREALAITMRHAKQNQSLAARMLGISRATLIRKLREESGAASRDEPTLSRETPVSTPIIRER
jgi:two-component system, NtrC family, response regulator AtoC